MLQSRSYCYNLLSQKCEEEEKSLKSSYGKALRVGLIMVKNTKRN